MFEAFSSIWEGTCEKRVCLKKRVNIMVVDGLFNGY